MLLVITRPVKASYLGVVMVSIVSLLTTIFICWYCFLLPCRLVFMRDDAFARVGEDGPDYLINGVENNVNSHIYRFISACYMALHKNHWQNAIIHAGGYLELCLYLYTSVVFCLALTWLLTMLLICQSTKEKLMSHLQYVITIYIHVHAQLWPAKVAWDISYHLVSFHLPKP